MLGASRIGRYASVSRLVQCRFASYSNWHEACDRTFCRRVAALTTRGMLILYYAVVFFIVALIAALFGFGGIAAGAAGIAKILFIIFLIVSIVTFLMSLARK